jgi:hypothetical protein
MMKGISMLQGGLRGNEHTVVGIDPGVSFGMTIINREYVQVWYGKLPTDKRPGYRGINAYNFVMNSALSIKVPDTIAVVEGAAYRDPYGQVVLEEMRFGFFFALYQLGMDVRIVPPATIRKGALGHGRATVGDLFPNINHNACDSIGAAFFALKEKNEQTNK